MRFLRVRSVQLKCFVCYSLRQTTVLLVCSTLVSKNPSADLWYTKPLAKRSINGFMSDISKSSKYMNTCTPHCLRATSITAMSDQEFVSRQKMYMSGHRYEASYKTYNLHLSDEQKRSVHVCWMLQTLIKTTIAKSQTFRAAHPQCQSPPPELHLHFSLSLCCSTRRNRRKSNRNAILWRFMQFFGQHHYVLRNSRQVRQVRLQSLCFQF